MAQQLEVTDEQREIIQAAAIDAADICSRAGVEGPITTAVFDRLLSAHVTNKAERLHKQYMSQLTDAGSLSSAYGVGQSLGSMQQKL